MTKVKSFEFWLTSGITHEDLRCCPFFVLFNLVNNPILSLVLFVTKDWGTKYMAKHDKSVRYTRKFVCALHFKLLSIKWNKVNFTSTNLDHMENGTIKEQFFNLKLEALTLLSQYEVPNLLVMLPQNLNELFVTQNRIGLSTTFVCAKSLVRKNEWDP